MTENKSSSLVKNASVLMIASMVSRVIGLLYRRPLGEILGSVGLGYYGYASNLYSILLLISSYSIPMAVSKTVSECLAKKEYKNANKIFKGSMLYAVVIGGITMLVCLFFGKYLLPANQQNALPALRALAPTIFLSAILGVLRGYFQAHRTMTPTSISQILEQIMNAIVSILAAYMLIRAMAPEGGTNAAVYGAMGGTIGTGAGVLTGLIFMLLVWLVNRRYLMKKAEKDMRSREDGYGDIFKMLLLMITPIIFTSFIYNCSAYLDSYLYSAIQGWNGIADTAISSAYGEYSNYYIPMIGIPLALASASTSAMMPEVSGKYAIGEIREANAQVNQTLRLSMFICIPSMVGLTVLAYPIMGVLFPSASILAGTLLLTGSVFVITDSFSIITGGVLQSIGKQHVALINAGISLLSNLLSLAVMLLVSPKLDIYAVMLSNIIFSVVCCILNIFSMRKYLQTRLEVRKTYLEPLAASAVMGAAAWGIYYGLFRLTRRPFICLLLAILAAVLVYMILYVKVSGISEEEMRRFPMGSKIVKVLRKMHVY
ncbi:MAG: polysaccharide biosynthesis protein [Eubacteriales bacterium]|nr:polysaccharide biosynthesis protein [Eubacteriales bacterium]